MIELVKTENHEARTQTMMTVVSYLIVIGAVLFQIYGGLFWLGLALTFGEGEPGSVIFAIYFLIFGVIPFGIVTLINRSISKRLISVIRIQRFLKLSIIILVINSVLLAGLLPAAIPAEMKIIKQNRDDKKRAAIDKQYAIDRDQKNAATIVEENQVKTFAIEALSYLVDKNSEKFISVLSQSTVNETESAELRGVIVNQWMPYFSNLGREKVAELINNNTSVTIGFAGTDGNITQLEIGVSGDTLDSGLTVVHLEKVEGGYTVRMILLTSSDDSDDPAMVDRYFRKL